MAPVPVASVARGFSEDSGARPVGKDAPAESANPGTAGGPPASVKSQRNAQLHIPEAPAPLGETRHLAIGSPAPARAPTPGPRPSTRSARAMSSSKLASDAVAWGRRASAAVRRRSRRSPWPLTCTPTSASSCRARRAGCSALPPAQQACAQGRFAARASSESPSAERPSAPRALTGSGTRQSPDPPPLPSIVLLQLPRAGHEEAHLGRPDNDPRPAASTTRLRRGPVAHGRHPRDDLEIARHRRAARRRRPEIRYSTVTSPRRGGWKGAVRTAIDTAPCSPEHRGIGLLREQVESRVPARGPASPEQASQRERGARVVAEFQSARAWTVPQGTWKKKPPCPWGDSSSKSAQVS
jgi:hypothetical protein